MSNQQTIETSGKNRIVVGVDGSTSSIGALRQGARIAAALGLPLEAIATWRYPDVYGGYLGDTYAPDSEDLIHSTQAMLNDTVTAAFGTAVPSWFRGSIREGGAAQVLIEESKDAEMLVVGSRGHGGFVGLLLGSVSDACVGHAVCPVLVYHADSSETAAVQPTTAPVAA